MPELMILQVYYHIQYLNEKENLGVFLPHDDDDLAYAFPSSLGCAPTSAPSPSEISLTTLHFPQF